MPETRKCSSCGAELPADATLSLCGRCSPSGSKDAAAPAEEGFRTKTMVVSLPPTLFPPSEKPGDKIGRYKLLQQIGEGGCGVVYMADQEEPVKRRVALKVIKPGMDTKEVLGRFEAERQALAMMDHPNIAKVLDAGATETGRPYFVMELVRGIPITRYCDENKLNTKQRLELFIQVCQAIQHAHQKGIIHRDIKPSNILVADHDGVPVPKIIDFGIAKATSGQTLTDKTVFTALEQFIGTPAYMSPEQAKMSGLDIDTRSDIYSLGVLLYELLTGKTPFDVKRLFEAGFDEIRRIIREEEPPRPSQKLSTLAAAEQTTTAQARQTDSPRLLHLVRGDLDWIVMKCLEKDRNRRYEAATGLASDILRHLNNEPVLARPPSAAYKLQKAFRRNKLVYTTTIAVLLALIVGLGSATVMFFRERAALNGEQQLRIQAQSAQKAAQASEQRALAAEAGETLLREQAEAQSLNAFGLVARDRSSDLYEALPAKFGQFLQRIPLTVNEMDVPIIRPFVSSEDNKILGGVSISAGFIYLFNQLAHAKAIDHIQPGYFEQYAVNLARETGSNSLPGLPNVFDKRYWTKDVMNDQAGYFNQMIGMTVAINLSHHYLGHFDKYAQQMAGPGNKTIPINDLLTPAEWEASVKSGAMNALTCALATDGVRALFDAIDKMPKRPDWTETIVPKDTDLKKLNKELKDYENQFYHGVLRFK